MQKSYKYKLNLLVSSCQHGFDFYYHYSIFVISMKTKQMASYTVEEQLSFKWAMIYNIGKKK